MKTILLLLRQISKASAIKKDLDVMKDENVLRMSLRLARECFAHGYDAVFQDGKQMTTVEHISSHVTRAAVV